MSKKKKNKKLRNKYFPDARGGGKKKRKTKSAYGKPRMKAVKPSLTKKEAKANKKVVVSPVDVPKAFTKSRMKCNHAADTISVEAYKALTPSYAAYTPALERMVAQFGEDNVCVCKDCYDVLVNADCVSVEDVNQALNTLYAACNVAVAHRRLKEDEIKEISKLKEALNDFGPVLDILSKISDTDEDSQKPKSTLNSNDAFVDP